MLTARKLIFGIFLLAAVLTAVAGETNYFCIVCGKGPLTGQIWLHPKGVVCDDCYKLPNHCSICGLPIRDGDGAIQTEDGRFICRFDKADAVLDLGEAREVFNDARRELIEFYGRSFALKYPDVKVRLFDVDYWSEAGRPDGLHAFGFANTRRASNGDCTHEVVLLSGRLNTEIASTAAHEYTHLWINENCPPTHVLDHDTTEAICELSGYKLMEERNQPGWQKKILANPYTHGEITNLVAIEKEKGIGYILKWVRDGTTSTLETEPAVPAAPVWMPVTVFKHTPPPPSEKLKLNGLLLNGASRRAIICGVSFTAGDVKEVELRSGTVMVRCREINDTEVVLEVDGQSKRMTLQMDEGSAAK